MFAPTLWNDNFFDVFDDAFRNNFMTGKSLYGHRGENLMKTDVRETEKNYELDVDLPGFKKEDVSVQLDKGYLTISAGRKITKEEKDKKGSYLRQERYEGACSRSFYVGDGVRREDITAKMEDGILSLSFPKKPAEIPAQDRYIQIQ